MAGHQREADQQGLRERSPQHLGADSLASTKGGDLGQRSSCGISEDKVEAQLSSPTPKKHPHPLAALVSIPSSHVKEDGAPCSMKVILLSRTLGVKMC